MEFYGCSRTCVPVTYNVSKSSARYLHYLTFAKNKGIFLDTFKLVPV